MRMFLGRHILDFLPNKQGPARAMFFLCASS
jgi:hypothetical protein